MCRKNDRNVHNSLYKIQATLSPACRREQRNSASRLVRAQEAERQEIIRCSLVPSFVSIILPFVVRRCYLTRLHRARRPAHSPARLCYATPRVIVIGVPLSRENRTSRFADSRYRADRFVVLAGAYSFRAARLIPLTCGSRRVYRSLSV